MLLQLFIGGDVAGADQLDAGLRQPEIAERLHQRRRFLAAGTKANTASRLCILGALQERHEVRVVQRHAHRPSDLPAGVGKALGERCLRIDARAVIATRPSTTFLMPFFAAQAASG